MTKKELRAIIMAAAKDELKGKRRANGRSDWVILSVRRAIKGGYGWFWIKFQEPLAHFASTLPSSTYAEPHHELHHLGDEVADAQRRFDHEQA